MKIISLVNPKGGAGKTVSAVNISYALARKGKKVLLIDSDPRSAIEIYLNVENDNTLYELIKNNYNFSDVILNDYITTKNGVDVIISSPALTTIDNYFLVECKNNQAIFYCIKELVHLFEEYDYVIFDTEGTMNNINTAILNITDYIFIPTKSSEIDLNGIPEIINSYENIKKINRKIEIKKVFLVDINERTKSFKEAKEDINVFLKNKNLALEDVHIRQDQNIINAMKKNLDIFSFLNSSNAAIDYRNLVDDFLQSESEDK